MSDDTQQSNKKQKTTKGSTSKDVTTTNTTNPSTTTGEQQQQGTMMTAQRQEQFQTIRKQMEDLNNMMTQMFKNSLFEGDEKLQGEGILRPFHSLGDTLGDRIFGPMNNNMGTVQQYMNEAQNMMKMAMDTMNKIEMDEKKRLENPTTTSTDLATTSSSDNQQLSIHKVHPVTKLTDQGSHVEALVQVPFENMEDIKFNYYSDNKNCYLNVRGRHRKNENEADEFEVKFDLPPNSDVTRARANVQGQNLVVTVPKQRKRSRSVGRDEDLALTPFVANSWLSDPFSGRGNNWWGNDWWGRDPFFGGGRGNDWWSRDPFFGGGRGNDWYRHDPFFDRSHRSSIFGW